MKKKEMPRGIRNHNPGNIRFNKKNRWQGADTPPCDFVEQPATHPTTGESYTKKVPGMCRFVTPPYGIRALAKNLITFQDKRLAEDGSAIDTVQEIVERWAPRLENDTEAYAQSVRKQMGFVVGQHVDCHDWETMNKLVRAIITHENGCQPYSDAQITKGLVMAGLEPPKAKSSRTMKGAAAAGGMTALGMVGQYAEQAREYIPIVASAFNAVPLWVFGAAALLGVGWIVWARFDDRHKGIRP